MGFFSSKQNSYLGVDLGVGGVKIVELANNKGRARLLTYGFAEEPTVMTHEDYFGNTDRVAAIIKQICSKSGMVSKNVVTSLPTHMVFDTIVTLPVMSKKDLKKAIEVEAQKLISRPLDEMVLYSNVLNQEEVDKSLNQKKSMAEKGNVIVSKDVKYLKVMITAAPKDFVGKYIEIFNKAGLKLLSLETASFALARSLVGIDKSQVMIADMGAGSTEIMVISGGLPVFSRSIGIGGHNLTKSLQQKLGLKSEISEQMKIDLSNNLNLQSPELIKTVIEVTAPIVNEIKYSMNLYFNRLSLFDAKSSVEHKDHSHNIEKLILTGGSSLLFGLNDYLKKELNIRVFIGDPWARVIYPQELKPVLDEIGPKFSIAIGLAMREISE